MSQEQFYQDGAIYEPGGRGQGPRFVRLATHDENPRHQRRAKSNPLTTRICCACRGKQCHDQTGEHQENHWFRVGWKFEYPKRRDIKGWRIVEDALKSNDRDNPIVRRAQIVVREYDGDEWMFPWANLYREGGTVNREKKPRHYQ